MAGSYEAVQQTMTKSINFHTVYNFVIFFVEQLRNFLPLFAGQRCSFLYLYKIID